MKYSSLNGLTASTNIHNNWPTRLVVLVSIFAGLCSLATITTADETNSVPAPNGLVGWWPGDGNGDDLALGNAGTLVGNNLFAAGLVGQAFALDGTQNHVEIPASTALNVQSLTMEAWIFPTDVTLARPVVQFSSPTGYIGPHIWITSGATANVYVNFRDIFGAPFVGNHLLQTADNTIQANQWQHVAASYDYSTGEGCLYINGIPMVKSNLGQFTPATQHPVVIGYHPIGSADYGLAGRRFLGKIDEVSIYNRALTTNEVLSIYQAGSSGKTKTPLPSLLVNGGFELPGAAGVTDQFAYFTGGSTAINGWTTLLNGAEYLNPSFPGPGTQFQNLGNAQEGSFCVDLAPWTYQGGGLQQTFATQSGATYAVTFYLGTFTRFGHDGTAHCTVSAGGASGSYSMTNSGSTVSWTPKSLYFTATNSTTTLALATTDHADTHFVFIDNVRVALVPEPVAPFITAQPSSQAADSGGTVTFMATAGGTSPLFYQWLFNGTNLAGATNATLVLTNIQQSNAGSYAVTVTNSAGSTSCSNATLTVNPVPGQKLWDYATGGAIFSSPALSSNGVIYFGAGDGYLHAIQVIDGSMKWRFPTGSSVMSSPVIGEDNTVFFGSNDRKVYAVNGDTGIKKWEFTTDDLVASSPALSVFGVLYVGSYDRNLYAINSLNGQMVWKFLTGSAVSSSPVVGVDNTVFVGSHDGMVYALDGLTGSNKWQFAAGSAVATSASIGDNGMIFVGSDGGNFYALDYVTGQQKWVFHTGNWIRSSPAIGPDGTVFVGSCDGNVYALDGQTGAKKWNYAFGNLIQSSPSLSADGVLYFGANSSKIYALNAQSGAKQWEFSVGSYVLCSPAIGNDGHVYIGADNGKFYAFSGTQGLALGPWPKFRNNLRNTASMVDENPVQLPPFILAQPANQVVAAGDTARFTVVAASPLPINYQWNFNGTTIIDATNSTLVLTGVQNSNAGNYTVVISNTVGSTLSSNALLTVNSAPGAVPVPNGLVGWWPGEGNGNDLALGNTGTLVGNNLFSPGIVGQAFALDGTQNHVEIPASSNLNVRSMTMETWMFPTDVATARPVIEYASPTGFIGPDIWISEINLGEVLVNFRDIFGGPFAGNHVLQTTNDTVKPNQWYHLAATYDYSTGEGCLYVNGALMVKSNLGQFTPATQHPVLIGYHPIGSADYAMAGRRFMGKIDEASIYSRALTADEVRSIYQAGSAGKTKVPVAPFIVSQPASQTAIIGDAITLAVTAYGTLPFTYQWSFKGTNIAEATNSTLVLADVQLFHDGNYAVLISNTVGSTLSSNAVLAVNPVPPPVFSPDNLLSLWRAEGNALDAVGGNNGVVSGNLSFGAGKVQQAFVFDGVSGSVTVPVAPSLSVRSFTIETWINPADITTPRPIAEFAAANGLPGVHLWLGVNPQGGTSPVPGTIFANIRSSSGEHVITSAPNQVPADQWSHVALTFDQASGVAQLYFNGASVASQNFGSFTPLTSLPFNIGLRPEGSVTGLAGNRFKGKIDELSLYSRALAETEIWAIYSARSAGKLLAPIAPFIFTQPAAQAVNANSTAVFSVAAGGTWPLAYQWLRDGANVSVGTNATLNLANVQLSQAGGYSVVITNLAGSITSGVAQLTVNLPPTAIRIANFNGTADQSVELPITLKANGNENALSFSVNFNPTMLAFTGFEPGSGASGGSLLVNTNQMGSGKIGIAVALPSGVTFSAGTQEVVVVSFAAVVLNRSTATSLTFGDVPTVRQLSDAQANVLAATYASGTVNLAAGNYEADVSPRPGGDKAVTVTDWVLIGRYVARLDYPTNATEFQRADCAPRSTQGDGMLKVSDWVQAGRYAAGLDPLNAQGGPTAEVAPLDMPAKALGAASRLVPAAPAINRVTLANATISQGQGGLMTVTLEARGTENAIGFSLAFDPAALRFGGASLGDGAEGATLHVNTRLLSSGKVGFALALPTGRTFGTGIREVLKLSFRAISPRPGPSRVVFADQPVQRSVADAVANDVSAAYLDGAITVQESVPAVKITRVGTGVALSWPTWAGRFVLQVADQDAPALIWSQVTETPVISDEETVVTVPLAAGAKLYRLFRQ